MTDGTEIVGVGSSILVVVVTCALIACGRSFGRKLGRHFAIDIAVCCRLAAEGIIQLAARRLLESERDRYEREWLAELDELRRGYAEEPTWSLVVFAFRVLLRAKSTGQVWAEHAANEAQGVDVKRRQWRANRVSLFVLSILGRVRRFRPTGLTMFIAVTGVPMILGPTTAVRWTFFVATCAWVVAELTGGLFRWKRARRPK